MVDLEMTRGTPESSDLTCRTFGVYIYDTCQYEVAMRKAGADLLGLTIREPRALHRKVQEGLPYAALERFQRAADLSLVQVADLVAMNGRTLARRRQARERLHPDESDRLLRVSRVFERALDLFGGDGELARAWFLAPQIGLGGERPWDFVKSDVGAREVERLIGQIEHGSPL